MLDRWVDAVKLSTPRYADSSDEFLHKSAESWIDGVYHAVAESDYSHLMGYCLRIASIRTSEGFRFSEVMKAISLATEIVVDMLLEANKDNINEQVSQDIRKIIKVMNWVTMSFGETFEDIRQKEFSTGTLIGLVSAQEAADEAALTSKLLEICQSMSGCTHGIVMMIDSDGVLAEIPGSDEFSKKVMTKIGTQVIRDIAAVARHDKFEELVDNQVVANTPPIRCAVGIPIMARGKILGALVLGVCSERGISTHEIDLLQAMASQIGLAYDNSRMTRQLSRKAAYLKSEHDEVLTILNELGAIVYVADMDTYEVLAANRPMRESYGNDIIGKICYKSIQEGMDGPCPFCTNKHLLKDGHPTGPYVWDFQNTTTGRKYRLSDRAIEWPDGRFVRIEIGLDITDFEEAKERLDEIRTMLQLYNDLLVHDISNHTSIAKGIMELICDEKMSQEQKGEMIKTAMEQMNKIDRLVSRTATLAKTKATGRENMAKVDLGRILDTTISDTIVMTDKMGVKIIRDRSSGPFIIEAGEFVNEIFINLLVNAIKYGNGKPVKVKIAESTIDEKTPSWKVCVTDEGAGVHPDKKALLFKRYERLTTVSQLKGLGLGLTIVRTLTETYGGRVAVEDRVPGDYTKGTIFSIEFPKASDT
ncbi:MAG: GAF domain-containing protein [Methanomassiliicoccus sp.]|nr:MAG: GAF domain-containing protein [Methanomassiliicoccus sp.]